MERFGISKKKVFFRTLRKLNYASRLITIFFCFLNSCCCFWHVDWVITRSSRVLIHWRRFVNFLSTMKHFVSDMYYRISDLIIYVLVSYYCRANLLLNTAWFIHYPIPIVNSSMKNSRYQTSLPCLIVSSFFFSYLLIA